MTARAKKTAEYLANVIIGVGVVGAAYVAVTQPVGRPYGQPALVASDQAASRLDHTGFDQAQGRGR